MSIDYIIGWCIDMLEDINSKINSPNFHKLAYDDREKLLDIKRLFECIIKANTPADQEKLIKHTQIINQHIDELFGAPPGAEEPNPMSDWREWREFCDHRGNDKVESEAAIFIKEYGK